MGSKVSVKSNWKNKISEDNSNGQSNPSKVTRIIDLEKTNSSTQVPSVNKLTVT